MGRYSPVASDFDPGPRRNLPHVVCTPAVGPLQQWAKNVTKRLVIVRATQNALGLELLKRRAALGTA